MKKAIVIITVLIGILLFSGCSDKEILKGLENAPFETMIFNVGKADCILIKIEDKAILIDTGLDKDGEKISTMLKENGVDALEYLILTHMDKDHIGGADSIINEMKINNLIQADYTKDSKQYNQYEEAVQKNNLTPILLHETINTQINKAEINIYPAKENEYEESNDYSIIVDITYGDQSFLFMGDAEEVRTREFLENNNKNYTFLKMPHHGRINKLTEKLIKSVLPKYSAITCSKEEEPDDETLNILRKYNVKNYLTKDGDVIIKSDGKNISITQEK